MFSSTIKNLSILKKFLFINLIIFLFIGSLTIIYLSYVQPNLIKKKTSIHIQILNNTIQNLNRLNVKFNKEDIKNFLFSKRFLFQSVDRVVFLDEDYDIIADTNTLDLDPRSFSQRIDIVEFDISTNNNEIVTQEDKINQKKETELKEKISNYASSTNFGKPFIIIPSPIIGLALCVLLYLKARESLSIKQPTCKPKYNPKELP